MAKRWYDEWVRIYQDECEKFSMVIPEEVVIKDIKHHAKQAADSIGVSETSARKYIDEEAVRAWVRRIALEAHKEKPGIDAMADPETVAIDEESVRRATIALAMAGQFSFSAGYTECARQCLQLISQLQMRVEVEGDVVGVSWIHRALRQMNTARELVTDGKVEEVPAERIEQFGKRMQADRDALAALLGDEGRA